MERRLIDANEFWKSLELSPDEWAKGRTLEAYLNQAPTIDAVEVVRCEKCLHSSSRCSGERFCYCRQWSHLVMRNHYCSCGARREPDENTP